MKRSHGKGTRAPQPDVTTCTLVDVVDVIEKPEQSTQQRPGIGDTTHSPNLVQIYFEHCSFGFFFRNFESHEIMTAFLTGSEIRTLKLFINSN